MGARRRRTSTCLRPRGERKNKNNKHANGRNGDGTRPTSLTHRGCVGGEKRSNAGENCTSKLEKPLIRSRISGNLCLFATVVTIRLIFLLSSVHLAHSRNKDLSALNPLLSEHYYFRKRSVTYGHIKRIAKLD